MATRFHIGSDARTANVKSYAKRFDFMEVVAGGPSVPSESTLRRFRKSVPPHFDFSVVAGPSLARVKPSEALERELALAIRAVDALQARCLLLATPSEVTPSPLHRERIAKVLDRMRRDPTYVVWEPRGLWETEDAAAMARAWGVVLAIDAAREAVPPGPVAYVRLRALGETRSFGLAALERVVRAIGARRDAFVILETPAAATEAKNLRMLAEQEPGSAVAATGRILRPQSGRVRVRDDEQE